MEINMNIRLFQVVLAIVLAAPLFALEQREGSPLDNLPPYIQKVNDWGERADFSHDGKRILFIEKTFGDAFELDLATGNVTPVTHHYYHGGYTRALYLANGDILLSGCTSFDAENAQLNRYDKAELWVLDKSLTKPPVRLGVHCFEGPAVSRKNLRIAWATDDRQYPGDYVDGEFRIHVGDIVYEAGVPRLVNQRVVTSNITNPFFQSRTEIEPQNFIAPDENRITLSLYGVLGGSQLSILDLATGEITQISSIPNHHNEPEGIYPDGKFTLAESSRQFGDEKISGPVQYIDIWKVPLDGDGPWEQITHFTDYKGYKSSNPVVSDDGRSIAFQMARKGDPAGVGRGLFILDLQAMRAAAPQR
jgi:hypothetical protein